MTCFEIKTIDKETQARSGVLKTRTGKYETPFFMPVATKGALKYLGTNELEQTGASALIANSFLLYLRPGIDLIKKHGSLHNFMHWNKCIFTDSGGFQVLSLQGFKGKFTDKGLSFHSPYDGSLHDLSPEKAMHIQETIGSDVAMALDHMPHYGSSEEDVVLATKRTHHWAQRCIEAHTDKKQLLFGIAQGGIYPKLRAESAEYLSTLPFDGFALGGICIGETSQETHIMMKATVEHLPKDKPRYLMGVGSPKEILAAVAQGVDIFDSVWPTRNARHGRLMTKNGYLNIENAEHKNSMKPLDEHCDCYVCKDYTCAYLHHIYKMKEPLAMKLLSYHNVYFLQTLMKEIRQAIKKGTFTELAHEYRSI